MGYLRWILVILPSLYPQRRRPSVIDVDILPDLSSSHKEVLCLKLLIFSYIDKKLQLRDKQLSPYCAYMGPEYVLRHGPTRPGTWTTVIMGASSRSRFNLNKIMIRIISTIKYLFQLYSPKN
ncbi:hypothetical protein TNCV_2843941 [Trichonephila clavipes]|nr:hypothetical protein TNCV_2843941 [Trichonephila clavipes]